MEYHANAVIPLDTHVALYLKFPAQGHKEDLPRPGTGD